MARDLRADGWARVDLFDEVDSTNVVALDTAERWHLVAAHRQRAGRGRLDRAWVTPAGAAVTVSMTLPLPRDAATWGWVPLFVGDAVRAAVHRLADRAGSRLAALATAGLLSPEGTTRGRYYLPGELSKNVVREARGERTLVDPYPDLMRQIRANLL